MEHTEQFDCISEVTYYVLSVITYFSSITFFQVGNLQLLTFRKPLYIIASYH